MLKGMPTHAIEDLEPNERLLVSEALAGRPFDLGQGPLFRVALLALDQDLHVLGLTFHRLWLAEPPDAPDVLVAENLSATLPLNEFIDTRPNTDTNGYYLLRVKLTP